MKLAAAMIDEELAAHDASIAEVAERKHELDRQQKRLEDEVAMITDRRTNIDGKLYSGEVTASKELLALQDEAASLLSRQTEMEDDDLVIMEQVEVVEAELAGFADKRAVLETERTVQEAELAVAIEEIEAELAEVDSQRSTEATSAAAELLERYEALRDEYGGVAGLVLVGVTLLWRLSRAVKPAIPGRETHEPPRDRKSLEAPRMPI